MVANPFVFLGLCWRIDCSKVLQPADRCFKSGNTADGLGVFHMRMSLRTLAAFPVLFLCLGCAQNVFANSTTFDFSMSGVGISASGTFTATLVSGNEYLVTSINGMQNGGAMSLLGANIYGGNNNEI